MKGKGQKVAFETIVLLSVLTLILFGLRFWPGIILTLVGLIAAVIAFFVFAVKAKHTSPPKVANNEPVAAGNGSEYSTILKRITELTQNEFPNSKWVWAQPDTCRRLAAGEEVFILLNGAGGYAKARVVLCGDFVERLEYVTAPQPAQHEEDIEPESAEVPVENYDLIAFEWVQANIMSLNARCNEVIGQGKTELILTSEELPDRAGWVSICRELGRNEYCDVECVPEGIKINLVQN